MSRGLAKAYQGDSELLNRPYTMLGSFNGVVYFSQFT